MNKPIFGKNLFSAKFLKKSVLPYTRRQIRRKYNKITAQKNIWVESDFDFFRFVVCCIQGSIFLSFFFFQNYWSAAQLTVTMLHLWRFTTLRPSWGGGESYFISEEQAFFWHRENENLSNKTGYCYLENTRILLIRWCKSLKKFQWKTYEMIWQSSQIHGFAFVRECLSFLHWKATLCCNTSEKRKHVKIKVEGPSLLLRSFHTQ